MKLKKEILKWNASKTTGKEYLMCEYDVWYDIAKPIDIFSTSCITNNIRKVIIFLSIYHSMWRKSVEIM